MANRSKARPPSPSPPPTSGPPARSYCVRGFHRTSVCVCVCVCVDCRASLVFFHRLNRWLNAPSETTALLFCRLRVKPPPRRFYCVMFSPDLYVDVLRLVFYTFIRWFNTLCYSGALQNYHKDCIFWDQFYSRYFSSSSSSGFFSALNFIESIIEWADFCGSRNSRLIVLD